MVWRKFGTSYAFTLPPPSIRPSLAPPPSSFPSAPWSPPLLAIPYTIAISEVENALFCVSEKNVLQMNGPTDKITLIQGRI